MNRETVDAVVVAIAAALEAVALDEDLVAHSHTSLTPGGSNLATVAKHQNNAYLLRKVRDSLLS